MITKIVIHLEVVMRLKVATEKISDSIYLTTLLPVTTYYKIG
jgi:hypothetical protein